MFKILFIVIFASSYTFVQNESKKIISKCCPEKKYLIAKGKHCVDQNITLDFSSLDLYDENLVKSEKSFIDTFELIFNGFDLKNASYVEYSNIEVFLTEDGKFYQKFALPNAIPRWTTTELDKVCVDNVQRKNGDVSPKFYVLIEPSPTSTFKDIYYTITSLISCIFLALVLIVYCILPELRSLGGLILMSYISSLLGSFSLLNALQLIITYNTTLLTYASCMTLTALIYYFFLASFFWVNIMSYDIWWTFRGFKVRLVNRRSGVRRSYLLYSAYAFGTPVLMTSALVILNQVDLTHIPWFIAPNIYKRFGCFLSGGEKLLYLYVPMLLIIISNCVFFLLTAFNIWRLYRDTSELTTTPDSSVAHRSQKNRFMLYIKLTVIMGISWILEVVSTYKPHLDMWYVTDSLNLLIGFAIFLIFVCKKKIYRNICNKFNGKSKHTSNGDSKTANSFLPETSIGFLRTDTKET